MAELGSRSRVRDASPLPSGTVESPAYPSLATGFKHTRKRDLDGIREARAGTAASSTTLGQFSFAPATRTTVVTTTTTTTTNFPPLVLNAPRSTRELDPKLYPLAAAPTPTSLRHFKFELGGKSIVFNEPEDTAGALQELKEQHEALKASNGVLRSVTVYDSPKQPTSSHRLSRQPASHPSSLKRRPVSPVSISESAKNGRRTRSLAVPSEPGSLQNQEQPQRDQAVSAAHPSVMGLATPKTETSRLQLGESSVLRRRIHNGRLGRKENSGSPVPEGVDSRDVTRTSYPKQPLPKDGSRASPLGSERTPVSERRVLSNQESQDSQSSLEDEDGVGEAAGSGQETIDEPSAEHQPQRTASAASSLAAIDSAIAQDMCLPSPSLSPVTAMNTHNADSFFDLTEDQGTDTDSSFENQISNQQTTISLRGEQAGSSSSSTTERSYNEVKTSSASLMDIPVILDFFDSVPGAMKNYLMYQLLKRCPKPTLQFIADVVNPALKCDFLAQLPLELSLNIVKYFDFRTMCRAAQVSKKWRHIVNSDEKTWKELFDRDGFTLPEGELQRAIREGWGWQFPNGKEDYEKDLSASIVRTDSDAPVVEPSPATASADGNMATSSSTRRPKRKAATRVSSRKLAKRKISSAGGETSDSVDWTKEIASLEGPYAAANAAAAAVPYPDVGLPSLRSLHLYKSLYQRHYSIRQSWMRRDIKPKHIAFRAHDRHVVTCLQFDTDKILTGSDDQKIHVYDTKTGALKSVLRGHEGGVWALEYHGNTLVSGSTDRTVRVWDIEKAKCTQVFHGHTSTVRCLQILLPAEVGKNADGTPEMMPKEPLIITGSRDSTLRVWRLPKPGDPTYGLDDGPHGDGTDCPYFIRVLSGHQHSVRAIAAHGDTLVSGSYDTTVRVWRISTGETLHKLQGHTLKVYSVVLDHARNRCISGSMDNMVKVWSLENGSLLYNLEGHTSLVGLLDLKNDRLVSAAADSTLRIWDPETGQCKSTLSAHTGAITCFQHDGQKVISGSDRTLKMWDVRTGECVKDLLTNLSGVWQVRFNDRRCVAAVQRDGLTYIEVLDFGAYRDGVPEHRLGKRILVDHRGCEASEEADDDVLDYEIVNG